MSLAIDFQFPNYYIEQTLAEASAGGALLYINNRLSYKLRTHLKICAPSKLFMKLVILKFDYMLHL